jgi:aminopeptidase N
MLSTLLQLSFVRILTGILCLLCSVSLAQLNPNIDGDNFCRDGKVRALTRQATNPKARLAYPGDNNIDINYYGLDLNLTYSPKYLRAAVTIKLKCTAASLSSFFLDLNSTTTTTGQGLRVDSVKANGRKLMYQFMQNRLTISPAQALTNSQLYSVTVYYQGIPNGQAQSSFSFSTHERTSDPVIWSLSEPYGAPDWFPCKDTPADKADSSDVRITAPSVFISVSNGTLVSTTVNGNGTSTYAWRNRHPIAHYLISIAMSNYTRYDTPFTYNGQTMPVTHYIYPEILSSVKANLDLTPAMLQLFTNRFGPYPFLREKYGHAQFGQGNGGMEHQTISSMEAGAFTPAVIAHELAHQWFGDKITCRDWQNIWLNEGFASYAEAVYAESVSGQSGYQTTMANFLNRARTATGSIYVQDISSFNNIFNSARSYAKGATVLHMLRGIVGDNTFFQILRTYTNTLSLSYQTVVTEDFQAVAEQVSGRKLDYFFKQWIYGEGYPTYRYNITGTPTTRTVTVQLDQRNSVSTNPSSFTMPVQLQVQSAAGDTVVTVQNTTPSQTFTLPAKGTVTGIVIDPNNWILKATEAGNVITAVAEPVGTRFSVYPNPASDNLSIRFSTNSPGPFSAGLTSLTGQVGPRLSEAALAPGDYTRQLSVKGLSAGQYILIVETAAGRQSEVVLVR